MDAMAGQRHHTGSYASGVNTVGASKGSQPQVYAQPHPQHGQHMIPGNNNPLRPMPVVKVLSPMGVEYAFLTLTLLIGAGALISVLMVLVNGVSFSALSFGVSTLLVTLPLFAWLFLRLKKMELQNPELRLDPSKRRSTQTVQIISFLVSLFTLIAWVYTIMASFGGDNVVSVGKITLNVLCILVVSVGILAYYWHDEHRSNRKGW
jgi:hypothetical protein